MKIYNHPALSLATLGLFTGFTAAAVQGCDPGEGPLGNLAEQCGLVCPDEGLAEGNASISGVASVDAFFGAVISVRDAAGSVEASVRSELIGLAGLLGAEVDANASIDALAGEVKAALDAKISANVEGSLTVNYQPAKCEASLEVSTKAAAECDVDADPGMASVKCEGTCEIDAQAQAMCTGEATLKCEGQAPSLMCSGSCTGSCQLEVAAECSGTCNGTCDGMCSAKDGMGNCRGSCMGMCQGSCELEGGGSCSGKCEGSCEYEPGGAMCEGGAKAKCEGAAKVDVECKGGCEGEVTPPMVKAECKAAVEAKAKANVVCTPPSVDVQFAFKASVNADAQAEFRAFLRGFKMHFSAMLAALERSELVLDAIANAETGLIVSANGAVKGAVDTALKSDLDLKVTVGLGCALDELKAVGGALGEAQGSLEGSVSAVGMISASVGG